MQIKNKVILFVICILGVFSLHSFVHADEFNISASEIVLDKENNTVVGKGSVVATDSEGRIISADNIIYKKNKELLIASGSVKVQDLEKNTVKTENLSYDKINELIVAETNSELLLNEGYNLKSNKIFYDTKLKTIASSENSILTDNEGNTIEVTMFQYFIEKKLFSSVGNIKVIDNKKNKYFFKELHVDTEKKEMIGSDVSALLDKVGFGLKEENDPRFAATDIFISKNKSILNKGVFTVCKQRKDKCPPWSLQAKKISHDKIKKTIYYDHAVLKVYDVPIFYFPKFFHPDPTVKRQSGFLPPFFTDSTNVGTGFGLPYYWAISPDKDLTFTTKTYANENILFLNEYRQAFRNGFLTLDTSYTSGYKNTSSKKTDGSRSHLFSELNFDFSNDESEKKLTIKNQHVSNDTYFRVHDINTLLVDSENTNLQNKISFNYAKKSSYVDISATVYEDLRKKTKDRYEHILPNIIFGKTFFNERFGFLDFKSNTLYKNYDADKHLTIMTNDIVWNPVSLITNKGFVNNFEGMLKNTNYEAKNTSDYKNKSTVNEFSGVLSYKSSLPMQKKGVNFSNIFSPNFMIRYAPGHMRNLSGDDVMLNYSNLYSLNKTSEIEDGLSAILGFDFKKNKKTKTGADIEKLSLSLGQIFNIDRNKDLPTKSSLDQKTSDMVGEINYNFSEIGSINYKFSMDHNYNDFNYNAVSSNLNFGKIGFNLDYLEERKHIGNENYVNGGITFNVSDNNRLSFQTKKNFKTKSTEFYDLNYEYINDCLTAGLVFRREYYEDSDIEEKDSLMFVIKFVPFTGVRAPIVNQ